MAKQTKTNKPAPRRTISEGWQNALTFVAGAVYFLLVCLSASATIKITAIVLSAAALAVSLAFLPRLRGRAWLPLLCLALMVLMDGVSTLYAISGKFALSEFLKILISFDLVLLLLTAAPGSGRRPERSLATVLEVSAALAGLVSVDLLSTHILSGAVLGLLAKFGQAHANLTGLEVGVRMTSLFTNPNVFAGGEGLGVLLALGLARTSEKRWERNVHLVLLYILSLSFVLAFSMGASAMIAAAFLLYLLMERREQRAGLLALMLETLVLVILAAAVISMTSFDTWIRPRPIPLLCLALGAAALCLAERYVGSRVGKALEARGGKAVLAVICGVIVLLAAYAAAAWTLTGPVSLDVGGSLRRAAYPEAGDYTLDVVSDGQLTLRVESQNRQETMMHTETVLYKGDAVGAAFTVPEDSLVLYFNFTAPEGARVESARYTGEAGEGELPLNYKLLPGFMANRLQGLLANENAIQRLVFFEDGLKLFRRSPVFGLGLGAFENAIKSVQSFYYETKYAHNHYIQTLVETGVLGLLLFLLLLIASAVSVWRSRKSHPMAPMLGACLLFMAGHASTEVVFSHYSYLPMAFGTFALINLCCGETIPKPQMNKTAKTATVLGSLLLVAVFVVLLGCNMSAMRKVKTKTTLTTLEEAIKLDKFEWADYALSYVVSTQDTEVSAKVRTKADGYAERLSRVSSNTIPLYLAEYYFQTDRSAKALDMAEKYVDYVSSDESAWQKTFALLQRYAEDTEVFREGVRRLAERLDEWNEANLGTITLDEGTQAFIAAMVEP